LENLAFTWNNGSLVEKKGVTLVKIRAKLVKMGNTCKYGTHLEK